MVNTAYIFYVNPHWSLKNNTIHVIFTTTSIIVTFTIVLSSSNAKQFSKFFIVESNLDWLTIRPIYGKGERVEWWWK